MLSGENWRRSIAKISDIKTVENTLGVEKFGHFVRSRHEKEEPKIGAGRKLGV